jgi:dTDP-4-amino-4,6-dideoxygalactose transaminase
MHGIQTNIHYPLAIPEQKPYRHLTISAQARDAALNEQILSLPLYHTLNDAGQTHLITALNAFKGIVK